MNRKILMIVAVLGIATVAVALVGESVMRRADSMQASDTSEARFMAAKPGELVKAVVRVDALTGATALSATLLAKKTESEFTPTSANLHAQWNSQTKFVMGAAGDLKPGTVIEVIGPLGEGRGVTANELVILSPYVHVAP